MADFTPATVPGCRVPHIWLANGASLYDALGAGYTLLKLDHAVDTARLEHAARQRGLPLTVLDLADETPAADGRALILVRPDQHIAWRDDTEPRSPLTLIDLVRGAA